MLSLILAIVLALADPVLAVQPTSSQTIAPAPSTPAAQEIIYKGKPRTFQWVDIQYAKFKDKIAKVNGVWRECGKGIAHRMVVEVSPPEPGTEIRAAPAFSEILQILSSSAVLAALPKGTDVFRIEGIKTAGLTDGSPLREFWVGGREGLTSAAAWNWIQYGEPPAPPERWLIYVGTYAYTDVVGAVRTIPSYAPYAQLTREEFIGAIKDGLCLVDYVIERKAPVTVRGANEKTKARIEIKIIAKSVP